jgi:Putative prokaryotic signal transducing protein
MKELLRTHSVSYAQGVQIALEAQGITAVLLDEQAPGYLGFAGRVRLAVGDDADYERAMAVVRALERPRSFDGPLRSWAWQRWGLVAGGAGFILLLCEVAVADTASAPAAAVLLSVAIALMVTGVILIAVGPSRDPATKQ